MGQLARIGQIIHIGIMGCIMQTVGILMSIFLGIIGLVIGLLLYQDGNERSTFISGWLKGLWISIGIAVALVLITSCSTCSLIGKYY